MVQLADLFSVPEISLLCNVAEYFEKEQLNYHPEILFRDVKVNSVMVFIEVITNFITFANVALFTAFNGRMPSGNA